jgi:hypothetical protein
VSLHVGAVEEGFGQPPSQGSLPPDESYRPLGRRARRVQVLLVIGIVIDLIALGSDLSEWALLERVESGALLTESEADANDRRQAIVAGVQGAVFIVTAAFFIAWFYRAYRNLRALGATELRFGPRWAVGAWFVPILNFWRPKQIANDIWRASNPVLPREAADAWHDPVPPLLMFWWLAFVAGEWLFNVATRLSYQADEVAELKTVTGTFIAGDILWGIAGVLAVVVVHRTTARQEARAAALGVVAEEDPRPVWRRKSVWGAAAGILAGFALQAVVGVAAWRGALDPEQQASPPPPSAPGILVEDDFSRPGAWLVQDDASLTFDYTGGAYRILVKERDAFWSSLIALPDRVDSMSVEVDLSLHAGRVRRDFYGVGCVTSSQGAYLFGISPDGYYTVALDRGETEEVEVGRLIEESGRPFRSGETPNRLRADCHGDEDRTVLRLFVNGRRLAETTDRPGLGRLVGLQFFVYSGRGGTDVRFDNLAVRELSPP